MEPKDDVSSRQINPDETSSDRSSSPDRLVSDWNYQKGLLEHIINKTRSKFLNGNKSNEFPQCTWFEEDDLLFEDTMIESSTNIDDQFKVRDITELEKTISVSLAELNEIVARMDQQDSRFVRRLLIYEELFKNFALMILLSALLLSQIHSKLQIN